MRIHIRFNAKHKNIKYNEGLNENPNNSIYTTKNRGEKLAKNKNTLVRIFNRITPIYQKPKILIALVDVIVNKCLASPLFKFTFQIGSESFLGNDGRVIKRVYEVTKIADKIQSKADELKRMAAEYELSVEFKEDKTVVKKEGLWDILHLLSEDLFEGFITGTKYVSEN